MSLSARRRSFASRFSRSRRNSCRIASFLLVFREFFFSLWCLRRFFERLSPSSSLLLCPRRPLRSGDVDERLYLAEYFLRSLPAGPSSSTPRLPLFSSERREVSNSGRPSFGRMCCNGSAPSSSLQPQQQQSANSSMLFLYQSALRTSCACAPAWQSVRSSPRLQPEHTTAACHVGPKCRPSSPPSCPRSLL